MRVLLIEDDSATAQAVELMLKAEGFKVETTDLGEEGVDLAKHYDYDLILLDLGLPDMSGLEVLRQIRLAKIVTPVMVVTGRTDVETKVKAFGVGADDFLGKPFHRDELVARMQAVIRRSKGLAQSVVAVGPITVNLDRKSVSVDGADIHLTGREYQMVELLALRRGVTITKEMFLNHLYGGMDEPEMKIIDVFVCKIRHKLRAHGADGFLQTIWGRGYCLADTPRARARAEPAPPRVSSQDRVLQALAARDATFFDIASTLREPVTTLRGAIAHLTSAGDVVNIGHKRAALYRITALGRERLARLAPSEAAA